MRNLVLLGLALILGYMISVIVSVISALNAAIPMIGQSLANSAGMLLLEMLIVQVICFAVIAFLQVGHITRLIIPVGPEVFVLGGGLLILFEFTKELLCR
jgi:hypothetical protein